MSLQLRNGHTINRANTANQENVNVSRVGKPTVAAGNRQGLYDATKKLNAGLQPRNDKRAALGEVSRNVANPIPSTLKDTFTKPALPGPTKTSGNPVVRTTRTVLARQSLVAKSTLPKVLTTTSASNVIRKTTLSNSAISKPSNGFLAKGKRPLAATKEPKSTYGISYNIKGPQVPADAGFRDFDKDMANDPLFLGIYCPDMFAYLRELETKYVVDENFLNGQIVTKKMRAMVVDWLVDVQQQYNLLLETFHLGIGIFDRFLEKFRTVTKHKVQLVGVTAIWIAAKYEELFSPELENFVYIADNAYSKKEILKMEEIIHNTLEFCYGMPLAIHFLRRFSHVSEAQAKHHVIAKYLLELSRVEYSFCSVRPSLVAAAALGTAFCIVAGKGTPDTTIWSEALHFYTTYKLEEVKPYIELMADLLLKAESSKLKGVQKKYASSKQMKISTYLTGKTELLEIIANGCSELQTE